MYLAQIGSALRGARRTMGLTQAELATKVGLSRTTINQLECGTLSDLGVRKLNEVLACVGLEFDIVPSMPQARRIDRDYLRLACISANVSFREPISPDTLAKALLSGKAPPDQHPHLRVVFDEVPDPIFDGLIDQVSHWGKPERIRDNVEAVGQAIHSRRYPS
jgi:transcriptional regulator with XRE-family HTH domain